MGDVQPIVLLKRKGMGRSMCRCLMRGCRSGERCAPLTTWYFAVRETLPAFHPLPGAITVQRDPDPLKQSGVADAPLGQRAEAPLAAPELLPASTNGGDIAAEPPSRVSNARKSLDGLVSAASAGEAPPLAPPARRGGEAGSIAAGAAAAVAAAASAASLAFISSSRTAWSCSDAMR
jgi:hypothetical protein